MKPSMSQLYSFWLAYSGDLPPLGSASPLGTLIGKTQLPHFRHFPVPATPRTAASYSRLFNSSSPGWASFFEERSTFPPLFSTPFFSHRTRTVIVLFEGYQSFPPPIRRTANAFLISIPSPFCLHLSIFHSLAIRC